MKTKLFKSMNLIRRGSGASLNLFRYTAMVAMLLTLGIGNAWAGGPSTTYYTKATVAVKTGSGTVYVGTSTTYSDNTKTTTAAAATNNTTTQNAEQAYYINAAPETDYRFDKWEFSNWSTTPSTSTATTSGKVKAASSTESNPSTGTAQATFLPISIASVEPTSVTLTPTDARTSCSDYTGSVVFTTSNDNAASQIGVPTFTNTGSGTWNATKDWVAGTSTVTYTFKGNGYYGGSGTSSGSRSNSATLTLPTAGGTSSKSVTFTANFPSLVLSDATENNKAYPINPTTDGTGTVVFPVQYCDGTFDFTATITGASGGTFTLGTISFTQTNAATGSGNITVPFTFNAGGAEGDFSATLTLTPQANTGGTAKSVTITAYAEAEATNDVSVTTAAGVTTEYATWAEGLTAANASAGSTLTLLRNVDLGTLAAAQSVTANMTLDLNGKTLSATVNATISYVLYVNKASCTLTIIDSKTGGKIKGTGNRTNALYGVYINNGNLTLNSGTIEIENTNTSQTTADRLYATGVYVNAGKTFTMNGGSIVSHRAARDAYGIYVNATATARGVATINGGTINVTSNTYAYGIRGYGDIEINGGTIHAETLIGAVAYGVQLRASANATASSGFYGELTMMGGTIEVVTKTTDAYGVFADRHRAGTGTTTSVDGTHSNQETGLINITGGTIKSTATTTKAYGIMAYGSFSSKDNKHITHIVKNATIEASATGTAVGICANAEINGTVGACHHADFELTDCTVTAEARTSTTAYCVQGVATATTIYKADQPNYYGEYASAAKITINSGTYTATAKNYAAYAVCTSTRARSTFGAEDKDNRTLSGAAEGLVELNIHGGTFTATSNTNGNDKHTRAVSSGGNTTIDGGTFTAIGQGRYVRCIYGVSGTLKLSGITINATSYGTHNSADNGAADCAGVFLDCSIPFTGFDYRCEGEINNCNITVTANKGYGAYGVYANCTSRTFDREYLRKDSADNSWSTATYDIYEKFYPREDKSIAGKCTINGGQITVKTLGINNSFGVYMGGPTFGQNGQSAAYGELTAKNTTIEATSNTTGAYGIRTSGPSTITNVNATVTATTSSSYGVYVNAGEANVTNSKFDVTSKTTTAYGMYANAGLASNTSATTSKIGGVTVTIIPTYNYAIPYYGELIVGEGNEVNVKTQGGNTSYAIYVHAAKANWTDAATYHNAAGEYAYAATAVINGGKYTATASGTTAYAAAVADPVLQGEATATPSLIINGGKFKGTATSTYADVSVNGEPGYFVLNGGYYVKDENLDKKLGEGMNKVAVKSGTPEYEEGYRYRVTDNMTGEYVCKINENSTSYASLEEALQVVNADPNSTRTIIMIANYTLSKGDYVLPANTTLLIPYQSTQTAINGATPKYTSPKKNVEQYEAPTPLYKLTLANGVNMSVYGKIEASAVTYLSNQGLTTHGTGVVSGKYGWLYLNEGSHIDLESGAALYAWGYVTGKGEINAKNGSAVYEDFQMGDWRGGTEESNVQGNTNGLDSKGVFLITHYYYQNIECPITYRAGAQGFAHGGTYMYNNSLWEIEEAVPTKEAVKMIGTSGAMFLMDPATAGEDTWVRKEYDAETDYVNWTMNSGAKLGSVSLKMDLPIVGNLDVSSSDYVLPITSNFNIIANDGEIQITNHVCFIPGSKLTIKKEGTLTIPTSQRVFFYDQDNWLSYGGYWFNPGYSPSWKVNPRVATIGDKTKVKMPDAEVLVEGLLNVRGAIYTTAGGANIHSTRENAGKVKFNVALPAATAATGETTGSTTLYQWKANGPKYDGKALNPAWLKNEDGTYSKPTSANTSAGDTWVYMQSLTEDTYEWTKASEDGCFTIRSTGDTKTYVHPSDWVAVGAVNANHAYPSEDATRMFVNTEAASTSASCKWWDVNPTPEVIDGTTYYVANNENFDNFGTYYYWDNTTSYWKPKKITVTWQNEDGTKITNGTYGDEYNFNTSPQFFGTNPKKTPTAIEKYDWIGWRDAEGNIYDKNATLPRATSNVTYTAYFNTTKYQYTITFKNDDNSDLWAGLVDAGTTGAELQALFETKYNEKTGNTVPQKAPTVDKVFTFTGWNTALATVTAAATYTAQYSESVRKYTVTFLNYNAVDVLYVVDVNYNTAPTYGGVTPFRANTSAFSYEWTGWQQGTTTYRTSDALPVVTGNISYIATFAQTELKYQVFFKRQDGSIIDAPFFTYEETPSAFPANPTMASTVSTDYTFREWSPATLVPVTEDGKVYTALFDESPRQYTAHFVNYNGTSLNADQTIDYNTEPAYTGVTPTKPNDARNSYEFSGWAWAAGDGWEAGSVGVGETLPAIKGNITFTAQFTPVLLQFNVIYQREDGTIIEQQKKKWGETTDFPTTGLNYEDETYTYIFDHWSPATVESPVTADATYTAFFNQSIKTYTIYSIATTPAGYGTVSPASLASVPHGSAVTVNGNKITVNGITITATPAAATAQYTYAFDHWSNVPKTVTGNISDIKAVFTRTVNQYTVLWKSEDGTSTIETDDNQNYGAVTAFNGTTPTKDANAQYTYTFDGWATEANGEKVYENGATPIVSGAATYYAHFAATLRKYTVSVATTPAGYGTVSAASVAEVPYGTTVTENGNKITVNGTTITATPAAATAQYTYAFSQWDNVPATVTGNVSIEAVFTRTVNQYTVLWKSEDGTSTIETDDNQNYGAVTAFNGTTPTKDANAQYTYTFDGWATEANGEKVYENGATPTVSGAATYYAHFAQTTNAYTVIWKNADGTELEKDEDVSYGTTPEYNGETPTQTATATDVYTFAGWDSEIAAVTGNITYTATYTSVAPVTSVTASGETTYYATLQEAFDYAADKATPTITVLKDVKGIATKLTYTNTSKTTVTIDLNGHTVAGKVNQLLYLTSGSNTGGTIVIKSSVEGGQIRNVLSSTSSRYCVYLYRGKLKLESGTIYNENTNTGASYAINVASGRTFTMTGGKLEAKGKTSVYTLYSVGTSNVSGGTIKAIETTSGTSAGVCVLNGKTTISGEADIQVNGTASAYGARVGYRPNSSSGAAYNGTLEITGGKFIVEASGASAIGVYSYAGTRAIASKGNFVSAGTANISGGQFDVTAATKAYGVYVTGTVSIATAKDADGNAYPEASAASKATITNGKFKVESTGDDNSTAYAMNSEATETSLLVEGGKYSTKRTNATETSNIEDKYTAPTKDCIYHVLQLTGEDPYKYEVAEAYTITFKDGDNNTIQEGPVKKGVTPSYTGATPTKTADAHYTYTFDGWSETEGGDILASLPTVSKDATYYAHFASEVNKYTVSIATNNGDYGTVSSASVAEVPYGTGITKSGNTLTIGSVIITATSAAQTAQYTYAFDHWENVPETVTGNVDDIQAVFTRTLRSYTVIWDNYGGGKTLETDYDVPYGTTPEYNDTIPTRDDNPEYKYTFAGWSDGEHEYAPYALPIVTGNVTYTAIYTSEKKKYTITWMDMALAAPDNVINTEEHEWHDTLTFKYQKPSDKSYSYVFLGWSPEVTLVEGNATYVAQYNAVPLNMIVEDDDTIPGNVEVVTTTVKVSGHLTIDEGAKLTTNDLILEASGTGSGDINGADRVQLRDGGNAYFDYTFDVDPWHWSAFGVPFEIDLDSAAPLKEKFYPMTLGSDYDIVYYDSQERAAHGPSTKCWKYVEYDAERKLTPGELYMIAFNRPVGHVKVVRFTKAAEAAIDFTANVALATDGTGNDNDNNWNGIANPRMYHALLHAGVTECQVHDGGEIGKDGYYTYDMQDRKFFVGKAAFVQVPNEQKEMTTTQATDQNAIVRNDAPRRAKAQEGADRYDVQIAPMAEEMSDRVFLLTDEDKADEYVIVSDLAKAGVSPVRPQMWVNRYGVKLCKNTVAMRNNVADYPLGISVPADGSYDIFLEERPNNDDMLYLTYDGEAIWNLSYGACTIDLPRGTNDHYGLRVVAKSPQVATGIEETTIQNGDAVRKVIVEDKVFIIRNGQIFGIDGRLAK